ncbi:hypothetical protein NJC40_03715 [Pseudomonas sp. 21LCFQ02]|uniref:hypothetical protein n=1 Tax=Pseudomonas sp. 21LCFQ02 TaxID=2957505 RepID=UPI00209B11EA|nr:hypothetical protein [Pseudomonas sp. 21LCFQ02]MCO8166886.1 hypothetical protein [Pseudomonas sp. 21LCFQ02]
MAQSLNMFMDDYRDHSFAVDFTQHQHGITIRYRIDDLPWRADSDHSWLDYEQAKKAGIATCKAIIDRMAR